MSCPTATAVLRRLAQDKCTLPRASSSLRSPRLCAKKPSDFYLRVSASPREKSRRRRHAECRRQIEPPVIQSASGDNPFDAVLRMQCQHVDLADPLHAATG